MSRIRHATETFVNNLIEGVKQLISSNTEQINVLLSMQNGFKLYKDFTEIGDNINNNTPLQTLIETMQDCSILVCNSNGGTAYKGLFGTLIVHKRDNWHADLKLTVDSGKTYTAYYNKDSGVGLRDFEEIATTEKTDILVTPTNGLKVTGNNVSFVEEIAGIKIYHGELEAAAPISDNPIVLTLPKFTSNTWRPVTFVKQDTKEAYSGWCYHGGQVRASLPAGKYNIDIIYT